MATSLPPAPRLPIAALERLRDSFVITDAEISQPGPRILYVNPAFTRMTGYSRSELEGATPRVLQGPDTNREVIGRLRRCLEEGESFIGKTFNYRKDGTRFLMHWTVEPIFDEAGTITHFFAIQRDVEIQRKTSEITLSPELSQSIDLTKLNESVGNALRGQKSHIEGLTLPGFVQLLELERKTCRLMVTKGDQCGGMAFREGTLIDASLDTLRGDDAALELLSWDEGARLDLQSGLHQERVSVTRELRHLLLDAMRLKDERSAGLKSEPETDQAETEQQAYRFVAETLRDAMEIEGTIGVALVNYKEETVLGQVGGGELQLELASLSNIAVLRAKLRVIEELALEDSIEDILISLSTQYHLIRPIDGTDCLFVYLALRRDRSNLAQARQRLTAIARSLATQTWS